MTLLRAQLLPITSSKRKKNDWTYKRLHTWSYSNKVESKVVLMYLTAKGRKFERKCEILIDNTKYWKHIINWNHYERTLSLLEIVSTAAAQHVRSV